MINALTSSSNYIVRNPANLIGEIASDGIALARITIQGAIALAFFHTLSSNLDSHINPAIEKYIGNDRIQHLKNDYLDGKIQSETEEMLNKFREVASSGNEEKTTANNFLIGYQVSKDTEIESLVSQGASAIQSTGDHIISWVTGDKDVRNRAKASENDIQIIEKALELKKKGLLELLVIANKEADNGTSEQFMDERAIAHGILSNRFSTQYHPLLYKNVQKIALFALSAIGAAAVMQASLLIGAIKSALGAGIIGAGYLAYKCGAPASQ